MSINSSVAIHILYDHKCRYEKNGKKETARKDILWDKSGRDIWWEKYKWQKNAKDTI